MKYDRSILYVIEAELDRNPTCFACGTRNEVRARGDHLVLECGASDEPRGLIARALFALMPHQRMTILA
jgi:lactate dehydrogenase-like 2-hydroxyacid dehydrogenase